MASQTRKLIVEILGDARNFARAASQADSDLDRVGRRAQIVGGAMMAAGGAMAAGLYRAAQAAMDDERAAASLARTLENTTGATGDQVAAVEDFIHTTQNATGVLDDQLRPAFDRLVRSTGDVSQAQEMLQTALDISAGTGRDLEAVSMALGRAHDGNVAGLGRLGIATRDAEGNTLSFAEVMANANQTFGGQAAAAAGTTAGQMAILHARMADLQEEVGAAVIPVLTELADRAGDLVGFLLDLNESTDGWVGKLAVGSTGLLLFGGAVTTVTGKLLTMHDTIGRVTDSRIGQWASANKASLIGLTTVIAAAGEAWRETERRQANAEARARSFTDALRSEDGALVGMRASLDPIIADTPTLRDAMAEAEVTSTQLASALLNQGEEWDNVRERLLAASDRYAVMDMILDQTQDSMRTARDAAADLATVTDEVGRSSDRTAGVVDGGAVSFADMSAAIQDTMVSTGDLNSDITDLRSNMDILFQFINRTDWAGTFIASLQGIRDRLDETDHSLTIFTEGGRTNRAALLDLVRTTADYAAEVAIAGGSMGDVQGIVDTTRSTLNDLATQFGWTSDDVREYIDALNGVPVLVQTQLQLDVQARYNGTAGISIASSSSTPRRAFGGPMLPGVTYIAGEHGPEPITLGNMSAYAHANGGMGGGTMTITVPVNIDGRQVAEALVRVGRNGGPVLVS